MTTNTTNISTLIFRLNNSRGREKGGKFKRNIQEMLMKKWVTFGLAKYSWFCRLEYYGQKECQTAKQQINLSNTITRWKP